MKTGKSFFLNASFIVLALAVLMLSCSKSGSAKNDPAAVTQKVLFETSEGNFTVALYGNGMPETVKNFVQYVKDGFYEGLIFHRVVKGFVIQGGGFNEVMIQKETRPPVKLETPPTGEVTDESGKKSIKLLFSHEKYAISMARTREANSATSQFFITLSAAKQLDPKPDFKEPNGYAVFGKVVEGFETVDKIGGRQVGLKNGFSDVPVEPVIIKKVTVVYDSAAVEKK
ncbi:MAG TPA: peptidylprolyl isomerase [bacterium]|nr:peptidylprolyl isomerase [bacterium]HPS29113.1 peptidylprolyl isomerase [bacterium]